MKNNTFIIVSNRLPVSVTKDDGKLAFKPSSGGLATAMSSLTLDEAKQIWIGWPGIPADDLTGTERATITKKLQEYGCIPVFLTNQQIKNFYEGYANDTLWPLFHYFESYARYDDTYWQAYKQVNSLFAKAINKYAAPNATVWIHDYHLMLLPQMVRNNLPDSSIGFFLHIPFPSFEVFRMLPNRKDILEGLLGADLIGFHTYDYARHFMSSALRTLGYENRNGTIAIGNRTVTADAFPIGIDYQKFIAASRHPDTKKEQAILDSHYGNQRIILSVDRLDYSKGIPNRLRAFETFLEQNPHYHKRVSLVIVAVPSRTEVPTYQSLRDTIEQTVSRINGTYASVDWTPISYQFKNLPLEQLVALYAKADAALVTPLRDGMNLVAKEYIAVKQKTPGVLILSELTGAADELQEALRINPNDTATIVAAIKKALIMPKKEQRQRLEAMQRRISQYTVQRWANDFIEQLFQTKNMQKSTGSKLLGGNDIRRLSQTFRAARKRSILLDYDGTLAPFVDSPDPAKAAPSKQLKKLLTDLAGQPNTEVCIISGRTREALDQWFNKLPVTLVAEHGAWVRQHDEWAQGLFSFQEYKKLLRPVLEHYAERTPGAIIEEKNFALVWHYRNVTPELAFARNSSLKHALHTMLGADSEVGVFSGNKILEIKPKAIRKSTIALELLESNPADFILCAGDDYTDEDMFEVMPETAYSIKVGLQETKARFQIASIGGLYVLLNEVAQRRPK